MSEWADAERRLSGESAAEAGRFNTDRAAYQRGIMDAITDPRVERVVFMKPAQIGWTTIVENAIGYQIDLDPCPILLVQPRDRDCEKWSKKRFNPMARDTPCLRGKVAPAKSRDPGNTILEKLFTGGSLTLVGANSPAGLSGDSVRIVIFDEVDRYPVSAGGEGDPVDLGRQRTEAFWNRKQLMGSTPRNKETSRIEPAFHEGDQRRYFVPCPDCGHTQTLRWEQVKWDKTEDGTHLPATAIYACEKCPSRWSDTNRLAAIRRGEWRAARPFAGIASFHLNRLYSHLRSLAEIVASFLEVKDYPERLKVWVNTSLAETYEEKGLQVDDSGLMARRESYGPEAPESVVLVTAAIDPQDDRLEVERLGWGVDEQTWSLDITVIRGDLSTNLPWRELDELLLKPIPRADGIELRIAATCLDSGGTHTQAAYRFARERYGRRVWAIKGQAGQGKLIWPRQPSKKNIGKVNLFLVGVDTAKDTIYQRLKITDPTKPAYCHFPDRYDEEYFKQLTAEKLVTTYFKGRPTRHYVKTRARNEAIDLRVYNLAAFHGLVSMGLDLNREAERLTAFATALRTQARSAMAPSRGVRSAGIQL